MQAGSLARFLACSTQGIGDPLIVIRGRLLGSMAKFRVLPKIITLVFLMLSSSPFTIAQSNTVCALCCMRAIPSLFKKE